MIYVALDPNPEAIFDPVLHKRNDMNPLALAAKHAEHDYRVITIAFRQGDVEGLREVGRCFVSAQFDDGPMVLIGAGQVEPPSYGLMSDRVEVDISCRKENWLELQRELMQTIINHPNLYVEEINRASDLDDVNNILRASSNQLEWLQDGTPLLSSILGDPDKLRVFDVSEYSSEDITFYDKGAPPQRIVSWLTLDWTERHVRNEDAGALITTKLKATADEYRTKMVDDGIDVTKLSTVDLCTFTPKALTDNWPLAGSVFGGFLVRRSYVALIDGPASGVELEDSTGVVVDVNQLPQYLVAKPEKKKAEGDGPGEYTGLSDAIYGASPNPDGSYTITLRSTTFTDPILELTGIQARQRRELVSFTLEYGGQAFRRGNGEPQRLTFSATGIGDDEITPEWQPGEFYLTEERQVSGITVSCAIPHEAVGGDFWSNLVDNDPESETYGMDRWVFLPENKSSLGRSDFNHAADTVFGRRCCNYIASVMVVQMAFQSRTMGMTVRMPLERAAALDTTCTVRFLHERLPGGKFEGKVVDLQMTWNFDTGEGYASVTIEGCIGTGLPGEDPSTEEDPYEEAETVPGIYFRISPYVPDEIAPAGVNVVDDRFFGWEQAWLINNSANVLHGKSYTEGTSVVDFLEGTNDPRVAGAALTGAQSTLDVDFTPPASSTGNIQRVAVTMTPWRGPKQVELI